MKQDINILFTLKFWWSWIWRSALLASVASFILGFIVGFVGASVGMAQETLEHTVGYVSSTGSIAASFFILHTRLKHYFGIPKEKEEPQPLDLAS